VLLYVLCAAVYSTLKQAADFFDCTARVTTSPELTAKTAFEHEDFHLDRLFDNNVPEPELYKPHVPVPESKSSMGSLVLTAWTFCCGMIYVSVQERFAVTALLCLLYSAQLCTVGCRLYCDAVAQQ
jgi:hypothetical protein